MVVIKIYIYINIRWICVFLMSKKQLQHGGGKSLSTYQKPIYLLKNFSKFQQYLLFMNPAFPHKHVVVVCWHKTIYCLNRARKNIQNMFLSPYSFIFCGRIREESKNKSDIAPASRKSDFQVH